MGFVLAFKVDRKSRFAALLVITTAQTASIWNVGIKTAAAQNMVAIGFIEKQLGAQITWVDTRDDIFPETIPEGVFTVATDIPATEVYDAPPGCYFLVLTHDHSLDFSLCEAILTRRDFAFFGLIGSATKRASFEHRLIARGLEPPRLLDMTCPIGIPGIDSKQPAVIAASVTAQLLQVREARQAVARAVRPVAITPFLLSGARP